jgi:hypothetical protein
MAAVTQKALAARVQKANIFMPDLTAKVAFHVLRSLQFDEVEAIFKYSHEALSMSDAELRKLVKKLQR